MAMTDKFWQILMDLLKDDVLAEERFATVAQRRENRDLLTQEIDRVVKCTPDCTLAGSAQRQDPLRPGLRFTTGAEQSIYSRHRHGASCTSPRRSEYAGSRLPIKVMARRLPGKAAVEMGANTQELLSELGYEANEIDALKQAGAV